MKRMNTVSAIRTFLNVKSGDTYTMLALWVYGLKPLKLLQLVCMLRLVLNCHRNWLYFIHDEIKIRLISGNTCYHST
jgi:hypothetical protein